MPRDPDTRRRILDAAEQLFCERGFAATSVREIVQKARVTNPMLYYYFGSKDELLRELLQSRCDEGLAELQETLREARTPSDVLARVARHFLCTDDRRDASVRFVLGFVLTSRDHPARDLVVAHGERIRETVAQAIAHHLPDLPEDRLHRVIALQYAALVGALVSRASRSDSPDTRALHEDAAPWYAAMLQHDRCPDEAQ